MWRRIWQLLAAGAAGCWSRPVAWWVARGHALAGCRTALHRRFDQQQRTQLNLWIQRVSERLTGSETGQRRGWRGWAARVPGDPPACSGCSSAPSAPGELADTGGAPPHRSPSSGCAGRAPRTDGRRGRQRCSGAAGLVVTALVFSLAQDINPPRTTRSPWRPPSAALVGHGRRPSSGAGAITCSAPCPVWPSPGRNRSVWAYALLAREARDWPALAGGGTAVLDRPGLAHPPLVLLLGAPRTALGWRIGAVVSCFGCGPWPRLSAGAPPA